MAGSYRVGDALVTRIPELRWNDTDPAILYPDLDAAALGEHGGFLSPGSYDSATGRLAQGTHSWLVRHAGLTILIDTATGNGKSLPAAPKLNNLQTDYLQHLKRAGVLPDQVDLVLITHVHADHVGWNTHLRDGVWVPTFPKARHVFSAVEARYGASNDGLAPAPDLPPAALGSPDHQPLPGVYRDSLLPIIEAGLGEAIAVDGSEIADGLSFHPTPGHSIDHASIRLRSRGEEAWFMGDVLHHPLQVYRPDLRSVYCEFIAPAERSRRWMLEQAADSGSLCFSSHFAETAAGHVGRRAGGFTWQFAVPTQDTTQ